MRSFNAYVVRGGMCLQPFYSIMADVYLRVGLKRSSLCWV